jgi:hypothetical protein
MSIADNVKTVMLTLWIIFGVYFGIATFVALGGGEKNTSYKNWLPGQRKIYFLFSLIFFFCIVLWTFTPSKKDCMLIIAGGSVGNFITSDSSSRALPADLTRYLHLKLNSELNDLGSETRKELGLQSKKEETLDKLKDFTREELINYLKKDTSILK